jgi:hypothetical protein
MEPPAALIASLLTIGRLQPGDRLNVTPHLSVSTSSFYDRMVRTLTSSENRRQSILSIYGLVQSGVLHIADTRVREALLVAAEGISNLQVSYASDAWIASQLQVMCEVISDTNRTNTFPTTTTTTTKEWKISERKKTQ